jgi:uncharacterized protein YcfL
MKKLVLILFLFSFLLVGCVSIGDHLIAKKQVRLVKDWNAPVIIKPVSCTLEKGEEVKVLDISTLFMGSSERETIYLVSSVSRSCSGWAFPSQFKKKK